MEATDVASNSPAELLPGTLDLLILRTLVRGSNHGYGIAQRVKELSREVFQVGESSLYPALQRLTLDGYIEAEWGVSENNRRARYYTLTAVGRKQLEIRCDQNGRFSAASPCPRRSECRRGRVWTGVNGTNDLLAVHVDGPGAGASGCDRPTAHAG